MTDSTTTLDGDLPFQTIVEFAAVGVGLVSEAGYILHANRQLCDMFGCSLVNLKGKHIEDVTHPDDRDADLALFEELLKGTRASYQIEKRYLRVDGATFWGRLTVSIVRRADTSIDFAIGMVEDITELRRLSHAIGERVKELNALHVLSRRLLRTGPEDLQSLLQFVADLLPPAFQYPDITEARVRLGAIEVRTPGFASGHAALRTVWDAGDAPAGSVEVQYTAPAPPSAEGPFLAEERSLLDSIADLLRIATIGMREAAERDLAEQALRVSEDRLQLALEAANLGTIEWDLIVERATISEVTRQIFAFADGTTVVSVPEFRERIHPDDRDVVRRAFRDEVAGRTSREHEYRLLLPDGSVRWVMVRGRVFFDDKGTAVRRIGVVVDVTSRHALEEQFRHAQKMEAVGRLAGGVAHDFNNLLTVVGAAAEFAQQEVSFESVAQGDLKDIVDAVARARALTGQLLTFSRRQVVRPLQLDLSAVVRNTE